MEFTDNTIIAIIVVIVIVIIAIVIWRVHCNVARVNINGMHWNVVGSYSNHTAAAKLINDANEKILKLLYVMRGKYFRSNGTLNNGGTASPIVTTRAQKICAAILANYNFEEFYENDPKNDGTSYTVNKGDSMHICTRSKTNHMKLTDRNTLVFVMLHELAHIGNFDGWGHGIDFWVTFKFILAEAAAAGIYDVVDYGQKQAPYCGMKIDYQPLIDLTLPNVQGAIIG